MMPSDRDPYQTDPVQPEIRAISDTFLAQLERLGALEERKRVTPVDDPSFPALAEEIEQTTRALLERAASQNAAAQEIHEEAVEEGTTGMIVDIPPDTSAARILALWREVERELAAEAPGSPRARDLERRSAAYRIAYQRAYEAARKGE
jgi:uncharacterized protein YciW